MTDEQTTQTAPAEPAQVSTETVSEPVSPAPAEPLPDARDETIKELQARITAYEAAEAQRNLETRFLTATGERRFVNDYTRAGVMAEFTAALAKPNNAGRSDADILGGITANRNGLFETPPDMTPAAPVDMKNIDDTAARQIMGLPLN